MEFILRDYQKKSSDLAIKFINSQKKGNGEFLKTKKNGILILPTGSGKSLIIADIISRLDGNILIFQPSKEILEQNYKKLQTYGILECSVYSASLKQKKISRVTFATIGSVINKIDEFKHFSYVIIDECHKVNANEGMYQKFLKAVNCIAIGLTATPYRLKTYMAGSMLQFLTRTRPSIFKEVIYAVQISDLTERGYLANLEYFEINAVDIKKLKINSTGSNYTDDSLKKHYQEINFSTKLEEITTRLLVKGKKKSILVFTKFIDEAEFLVNNLKVGTSAIVTGQTKLKERERILKDFKDGKINVVANVGVLTIGFDFPELECVVLARPTRSLALYYQIIGRAIRPHKNKKTGWIVDLSGTYKLFGKVENLKLSQKNGWHIYNEKGVLTNKLF